MTTKRRHRHILAAAALIDSMGDGLYLAGSALFFTRGIHLPVTQVGLGLSIAGIVGLAAGTEIGRIADRFGPRNIFILLMLTQTAAVAAYTLVTGIVTLALFATVAAVSRQGAQAARGAIVGQVAGNDASTLRAYLHAVINVGIAVGAAAAGFALALDTHAAYLALMLADAATFTLAAAVIAFIPSVPGAARPAQSRKRLALTDRRFVALTALSAVVSLQFVVSGYLLPLWVALHTDAPRWLASPLLFLNTALVVGLQVRVSSRHKTVDRAASAFRAAGALLVSACAVFGFAHYSHSTTVAVALLVTAMVIASVAELYWLAGAFTTSYALAPAHAVGEYQGVWNLGFGTSIAVGPAILTLVCLKGGPFGWLLLGAVMFACALTMSAIVTKSESSLPSGVAEQVA